MSIFEEVISEIFKGDSKIIQINVEHDSVHISAETNIPISNDLTSHLKRHLQIIECFYVQDRHQKLLSFSYNLNVPVYRDFYGLYVYLKFKGSCFVIKSDRYEIISNRENFLVSRKIERPHGSVNITKKSAIGNNGLEDRSFKRKRKFNINPHNNAVGKRFNKAIVSANYIQFLNTNNFKLSCNLNGLNTKSYKQIEFPVYKKNEISDSFIIGQLACKFILCIKNDRLFMIDQHALHERIRFELNRTESDIERAKSIACRGAIKFGEKLNFFKMYSLVRTMRYLKQPFICVHGRPSIIQLR